jgi:uncharacterized protein YndB with AHSA1/START domain
VTRTIHLVRRYPYSPETVWRWLANREAMSEWLMPNTFEPVIGHCFEFRTRPAPGFDGIVRCKVLELDPPKRLAFTWVGGGIDTVVTFALTPDRDGTVLTFSHARFNGVKGVMLSYMLGNGWRSMLDGTLPKLLERAAGRPADSEEGCGEDKSRFWRLFDRVFSR